MFSRLKSDVWPMPWLRGLTLAVAAVAIMASVALAQDTLPQTTPARNLRPYWHVFAAYTIVIVMIGGWAVSIARRLRAIEARLVD